MKRIPVMLLAMLLTLTACKGGEVRINDGAEPLSADGLQYIPLSERTPEPASGEDISASGYTDPVETVRAALEKGADYEISPTRLLYAYVNDGETERYRERTGAEANRAACVTALYYCQYDHTLTFMNDGYCKADYYLLCDENTECWEIADNMTPSDYPTLEELLSSSGITEADLPDYGRGEYQYAKLARIELDDRLTAYVDVYYNDIVEMDGVEYYEGVPYLVVQSKAEGRTLATTRVATPLVSEHSALSPQRAYLMSFELEGERIIALQMPLDERNSCSAFYHYTGDMYGIYPCGTSEGMILNRSIGVNMNVLRQEGDRLTDSDGRGYEFDFGQYPAYITISS